MKNAQAKIDALLDALVDRLHEASVTSPVLSAEFKLELEWLVKMSNLNNARQEKTGKLPGPQSKAAEEVSDADLVKGLIAGRDPDLFPRRGPRKGKRENVSTPLESVPDVVTCAVHEGVVCVLVPGIVDGKGNPAGQCPDCAKEAPARGFVSLKALL